MVRGGDESETRFSLDKQLVTSYRTTHTDGPRARSSGVWSRRYGGDLTRQQSADLINGACSSERGAGDDRWGVCENITDGRKL